MVFGALVAAGIPVLLAVTSVLAALGLLGVVGNVIPANSTVSSVVLLIGMAVGVDYSLFYLRREREERAAGRSALEALEASARTSGHAVVISGLTVMLSVAGLFITGIDVFNGMAVGTVLVVGLAVLGSVTVLPATIALLGHRVDSLRIPYLGRRLTTATESRTWTSIARGVVRRPLLMGGTAVVLLLALAAPALGMKLSDPGQTRSLRQSGALPEVQRLPKKGSGGLVVLPAQGFPAERVEALEFDEVQPAAPGPQDVSGLLSLDLDFGSEQLAQPGHVGVNLRVQRGRRRPAPQQLAQARIGYHPATGQEQRREHGVDLRPGERRRDAPPPRFDRT